MKQIKYNQFEDWIVLLKCTFKFVLFQAWAYILYLGLGAYKLTETSLLDKWMFLCIFLIGIGTVIYAFLNVGFGINSIQQVAPMFLIIGLLGSSPEVMVLGAKIYAVGLILAILEIYGVGITWKLFFRGKEIK